MSYQHILISCEEYERLKKIEKEFENQKSPQKEKGNVIHYSI